MPAPVYPPPIPGLERITHSTLQTYLRCGLLWEQEREAKARHATVRMLIGSGVSEGAKVDNHAKIGRGSPASLSQIVEAAVTDYEKESAECDVPATPHEIAEGKDDTAAAARTFGLEVSPRLARVLAAEMPILARIRGIQLAGTPDVVTEEGIGDLKTGQPWTQERADRSRQLTIYGILHRIQFGRMPRRVWIDSISHNAKGWRAERLYSTRTIDDFAAAFVVIEKAAAAMKAGVALPAPEGAWWCSPTWCPFFRGCSAVRRA